MRARHLNALLTVALPLLGLAWLTAPALAGPKVAVCHFPPGNPDNFHTITISENALPAHLAHGDLAGACNALCAEICDDGNACTIDDTGDCEQSGCPVGGPPTNCSDGLACTEDSCDPASGCENTPILCQAPDLCTVSACAEPEGMCVDTPVVCSDGQECDPGSGLCVETGKTVFVTSLVFRGDLISAAQVLTGVVAPSGAEAGDLICQKLADDAGLGGAYKAWLSDSFGSAALRLNHAVVPYVRTDGVIVANDFADLVAPKPIKLQTPINLDENGLQPATGEPWTGTDADGSTSGLGNCIDWTTAASGPGGGAGDINEVNSRWTNNGTRPCNRTKPLYCFEQ